MTKGVRLGDVKGLMVERKLLPDHPSSYEQIEIGMFNKAIDLQSTRTLTLDINKTAKLLFYMDNPDLDSVKGHHTECSWENWPPEDRAHYFSYAKILNAKLGELLIVSVEG